VILTAYTDRSFEFVTKTPPVSWFIKQACGLELGSGLTGMPLSVLFGFFSPFIGGFSILFELSGCDFHIFFFLTLFVLILPCIEFSFCIDHRAVDQFHSISMFGVCSRQGGDWRGVGASGVRARSTETERRFAATRSGRIHCTKVPCSFSHIHIYIYFFFKIIIIFFYLSICILQVVFLRF
jgi:hypothetical protein